MRPGAAVLLALVVALVCSPLLAARAKAPIAVMAFKNLNSEQDIDWLRVGIAETMVSDLKRAGYAVVERDQLDKALAEIVLQGALPAETSTAAQIGKMVGARTVVVGGFQRAGKQVRITARFVSVETGEIKDTAKTTGSLKNIFALQDQIVGRLTGKKPPPRKRPRKRTPRSVKTGEKASPKEPTSQDTVDAYRLFSLSLLTNSDAERVQFLKKAIALDPAFTYAVDDLDALEKRLRGYEKQSVDARRQQAKRLMSALDDPGLSDQERTLAVQQTMGQLMAGFRYKDLLQVAERTYAMNLPPYYGTDPREMASYYIFLSHQMLKQNDLMLQAGERHLKDYPASVYALGVTISMDTLIQRRREAPARVEKYEAELAEAAADLEELAGNERIDKQNRHQRRYYLEAKRCTAARSAQLHDVVLRECPAFLKRWRNDAPNPNMLHVALQAIILAHGERGEFAAGREVAERWREDDPAAAARFGISHVVRTWPRD